MFSFRNCLKFSKLPPREYFMHIDHKGMLYLEETHPKNYTSCIKDVRFFKWFHQNLVVNETGRHNDTYKYLSKCWGEYNFVSCFATPIVFNDLVQHDGKWVLTTVNGYHEEFDGNKLMMLDGILHHKVSLNNLEQGIFSTDLSIVISEHIVNNTFTWENNTYPLR